MLGHRASLSQAQHPLLVAHLWFSPADSVSYFGRYEKVFPLHLYLLVF